MFHVQDFKEVLRTQAAAEVCESDSAVVLHQTIMRGAWITTDGYPGRATVALENLELANLDVSISLRALGLTLDPHGDLRKPQGIADEMLRIQALWVFHFCSWLVIRYPVVRPSEST